MHYIVARKNIFPAYEKIQFAVSENINTKSGRFLSHSENFNLGCIRLTVFQNMNKWNSC